MSVDPPRWPHTRNRLIKYVDVMPISSLHARIEWLVVLSVINYASMKIAQTSLKGVDCLLLTSLTMTPLHNPNPMIGEFCQTVCDTIRQGGNVLVPCYPSGKKINLNFNPTFYKKCRVASTRARARRDLPEV